ncbi:MAG: DUF1194 domain-containing protein [Rhizobiales bacterium]|nr:DUF1194 domain-containing protein [Hyphomicrobiales bacterium]
MATPRPTRRVFGAGLLAALASGPARAAPGPVDLALVLAIDCSFSVDSREFRLQMQGIGDALASAETFDAVRKGPLQKIAVAVFLWSDLETQVVILPWSIIATPQDAQRIGDHLIASPRTARQGGTAISAALLYGGAMMELAPTATRRVIDLSTDGRNNMGKPAFRARDEVVARGITINGLAIANEWPTLDVYLERQVAGGPSHFVVKADSYDDFGAAMQRKLIREITGPGVT